MAWKLLECAISNGVNSFTCCMCFGWSQIDREKKKSNFIQIIVWRKQNAHNFLRKTKHIHTRKVFWLSTFWGYTQRNHSKMILTTTFLDKPIVRQVNEINYDWLFWFEWVRGGNWTNYFSIVKYSGCLNRFQMQKKMFSEEQIFSEKCSFEHVFSPFDPYFFLWSDSIMKIKINEYPEYFSISRQKNNVRLPPLEWICVWSISSEHLIWSSFKISNENLRMS